jgi:hypothetical protein
MDYSMTGTTEPLPFVPLRGVREPLKSPTNPASSGRSGVPWGPAHCPKAHARRGIPNGRRGRVEFRQSFQADYQLSNRQHLVIATQ